jgi:hypothetical protein
MPIQTLADINRAFDDGRWHLQRFIKNAGTAHALQWCDPTFASGQPAYDAHVGAALAFTPAVAQRNDAIWFPGIDATHERRLISATFRDQQATYNGPASVVIYDLLGYYPLIDGDSADEQPMDNTAALPRYATGDGVVAVMVNHVAPAVQGGIALLTYTDAMGVQRTSTVGVPLNGVNLVCSNSQDTAALDVGALAMSLNAPAGVRSIDALQYTTPPGGLHAIYLIKPLATVVCGDNLVAVEKDFYGRAGLHCPRVHDGAWLGWFNRIGTGTARTVAWWGHFTFAWG